MTLLVGTEAIVANQRSDNNANQMSLMAKNDNGLAHLAICVWYLLKKHHTFDFVCQTTVGTYAKMSRTLASKGSLSIDTDDDGIKFARVWFQDWDCFEIRIGWKVVFDKNGITSTYHTFDGQAYHQSIIFHD